MQSTQQPQTRVMQEVVRACASLRLILARPELYIETVSHARCLLTVVSQVPVFNFCEHFMSITSSIMSVCSLRIHLFFDLFYLVVKLVPFLLCIQSGLIRFHSALLYHLEPPMHHQLVICIEQGSFLISRTFSKFT